MQTWITIFISIPIGAISSLIAWWILNFAIKPKVKFSDDISKIIQNSTAFYRLKFENAGKRKILECTIIAKLRIKGISFKTNWEVLYLPLDNDFVPILKSSTIKKKRLREVPRLELNIIDSKYFRFLPDKITDKIKDNSIELEDLLRLGTEAELRLIVSGYDGISGAKKTYESKPYKISDIKKGKFDNHGLNVISV